MLELHLFSPFSLFSLFSPFSLFYLFLFLEDHQREVVYNPKIHICFFHFIYCIGFKGASLTNMYVRLSLSCSTFVLSILKGPFNLQKNRIANGRLYEVYDCLGPLYLGNLCSSVELPTQNLAFFGVSYSLCLDHIQHWTCA